MSAPIIQLAAAARVYRADGVEVHAVRRVSLDAARVLHAEGIAAHSRLVTGNRPSYPVAPRDEGA